MCMYSTVCLSPEQTQIWSGSGLRQYWCFGDCHEQPQNDKCLPHPLLSASKQLAILSDLHVSYPILCDPNHLGHEQMGSAAGVWVSDCDQKPTEWFSLRTSQCSSLECQLYSSTHSLWRSLNGNWSPGWGAAGGKSLQEQTQAALTWSAGQRKEGAGGVAERL